MPKGSKHYHTHRHTVSKVTDLGLQTRNHADHHHKGHTHVFQLSLQVLIVLFSLKKQTQNRSKPWKFAVKYISRENKRISLFLLSICSSLRHIPVTLLSMYWSASMKRIFNFNTFRGLNFNNFRGTTSEWMNPQGHKVCTFRPVLNWCLILIIMLWFVSLIILFWQQSKDPNKSI